MRDISSEVRDYRASELHDEKFTPKVFVFEDDHQASVQVADDTAAYLRENPGGLINAAGGTFVEAQNILATKYGDLIRQRALACLDELYPLDYSDPDDLSISFREMILKNLVRPAGLPDDRLIAPDGSNPSLIAARARFQNQMLAELWAVTHIGVGPDENPESGAPSSHHFGMINRMLDPKYRFWTASIDEGTKSANSKDGSYPGRAITVGPGLTAETGVQMMMALGDRKKIGMDLMLLGQTDLSVPINHAHFWPAVRVYLDKISASIVMDRLGISF